MGEKDRRHGSEMRVTDESPQPGCGTGKSDSGLPSQLQGAIGKQLRQVYGQMLSEPLPDKFSELLNALGKSGSKE